MPHLEKAIPILATMNEAETRWRAAVPVAEDELDFDYINSLSQRVSAQLFSKLFKPKHNGPARNGPMARVLSYASLGDRARCAAACLGFASLEGNRSRLANQVFQKGRVGGGGGAAAAAVAQRVLFFLPPRQRCKASFACKGWASLTNPDTCARHLFAHCTSSSSSPSSPLSPHMGEPPSPASPPPLPPHPPLLLRLPPPALDLVLLMDAATVPKATSKCTAQVLKEVTRALTAAMPELELRVGAIVCNKYPKVMAETAWEVEGFPHSGEAAASKGMRRRNNLNGSAKGLKLNSTDAAALKAAEASERREAWRDTLGAWFVDESKRDKANECFVARRFGFEEAPPPQAQATRRENKEGSGNTQDGDGGAPVGKDEEEGNLRTQLFKSHGHASRVWEMYDQLRPPAHGRSYLSDSEDGMGTNVEAAAKALREEKPPKWALASDKALKRWRRGQARARAKEKADRRGFDEWMQERAGAKEAKAAAANHQKLVLLAQERVNKEAAADNDAKAKGEPEKSKAAARKAVTRSTAQEEGAGFTRMVRKVEAAMRQVRRHSSNNDDDNADDDDGDDGGDPPESSLAAGLALLLGDQLDRQQQQQQQQHSDGMDAAIAAGATAAAGGVDLLHSPSVGSPLHFRPHAVKLCIVVSSAPPIGLELHPARSKRSDDGESVDSGNVFPKGDPCGFDPVALTHALANITFGQGTGGGGGGEGVGGGGNGRGLQFAPVVGVAAVDKFDTALGFFQGMARISGSVAPSSESSQSFSSSFFASSSNLESRASLRASIRAEADGENEGGGKCGGVAYLPLGKSTVAALLRDTVVATSLELVDREQVRTVFRDAAAAAAAHATARETAAELGGSGGGGGEDGGVAAPVVVAEQEAEGGGGEGGDAEGGGAEGGCAEGGDAEGGCAEGGAGASADDRSCGEDSFGGDSIDSLPSLNQRAHLEKRSQLKRSKSLVSDYLWEVQLRFGLCKTWRRRYHDARVPTTTTHKTTPFAAVVARSRKHPLPPPPASVAATFQRCASVGELRGELLEAEAEKMVRASAVEVLAEARRAQLSEKKGHQTKRGWPLMSWVVRRELCHVASVALRALDRDVMKARAEADIKKRQVAAANSRKHRARMAKRIDHVRAGDVAASSVFIQAALLRFLVRARYQQHKELKLEQAKTAKLARPASFVESWEKPLDSSDLFALLA